MASLITIQKSLAGKAHQVGNWTGTLPLTRAQSAQTSIEYCQSGMHPQRLGQVNAIPQSQKTPLELSSTKKKYENIGSTEPSCQYSIVLPSAGAELFCRTWLTSCFLQQFRWAFACVKCQQPQSPCHLKHARAGNPAANKEQAWWRVQLQLSLVRSMLFKDGSAAGKQPSKGRQGPV